MMKNFYNLPFLGFAALGLAFTFAACGDDSSSSSASYKSIYDEVKNLKDLDECTKDNDGDTLYVNSEEAYYVCQSEDWKLALHVVEDKESLKTCDEKRKGEYALTYSDSTVYVCDGKEWLDVKEISSSSAKSSSSTKKSSSSEKTDGTSSDAKSSSSAKNSSSSVEEKYKAVDLGLSVDWAEVNIGAENAADFGDYFAYGETETKDEYSENTLIYNVSALPSNISGNKKYDAAAAKWGGKWRMPTEEEMEELKNSCTWTWNETKKGYQVIGTNGNSIFMPTAGYRYDSDLWHIGFDGNYWSSTAKDGPSKYADA